MRRTRLCELLDIELPILGAPMGPEIASLELAGAVSNAGGLGMISFGGYPPARLKERIKRLRSLTSRPFGVNVLLQGPHLPLPEAAFVDVCIEERIPVLFFFWGDSDAYHCQSGAEILLQATAGTQLRTASPLEVLV
jgi:nitronate monooxygenase